MQKPIRELGLKRFWAKASSANHGNGDTQSDSSTEHSRLNPLSNTSAAAAPSIQAPNCSLPLLQVWPSSDSPRGEADGQSFVFPVCAEDANSQHSTSFDAQTNYQQNDSGIESIQVSPSPLPLASSSSPLTSPTPSVRRPSSSLLHPDHARLFRLYPQSSPENTSLEDVYELQQSGTNNNTLISQSSSTASSQNSVSISRTNESGDSRRRSSIMTARYSLFDALDLEYALLRAAARGSVGPYSLSESLHKLTFTQSLAFPALARGLAGKHRRSQNNMDSGDRGCGGGGSVSDSVHRRLNSTEESGLTAFVKILTAFVLVIISILVFVAVYKFVRT